MVPNLTDMGIDTVAFVFSRSPSTAASTASRVDQPPAYSGQPPSYQQATNNEAITDDLINLGMNYLGAILKLRMY